MDDLIAQVGEAIKLAPVAVIAAAIFLTNVIRMSLGGDSKPAGRFFSSRLIWLPSMVIGLLGSLIFNPIYKDFFNWLIYGLGYGAGSLSAVLVYKSVMGKRKRDAK